MSPSLDVEGSREDLEVQGNEILVMAPRIQGLVEAPQKPIEVLDEADIASYGASSIEELISLLAPQTGSGRGRGGGRPVMLINGQRITSWREMRNIPPEAIRTLEILPEEVALRYGYAANQRVVNIILKDQFAAASTAGEYNRPTRGGYDNYELEGGLFSVSGPRRYNFSGKLTQTSMLTEDERDIEREEGELPTVAGDPDPRAYRSLAGEQSEFELEGTVTQGLGEGGFDGSVTASAGYSHTIATTLSGLDTVRLEYDGNSQLRALPDPLTQRAVSDVFEGSLGYNNLIGDWQFSVTADGSYTDTNTRIDRRRDLSGLQDAALAGDLAIDGPLPMVGGAGVDVARSRDLALTSLATLSGTPFRMPAGDANLTAKLGYDFSRTLSDDTRSDLGTIRLKRGDVSGGLNLALPLTSKGEDFLGAVGDIALNLSAGLNHLSDFGTLSDWSAGVTWAPTDALSFQATYFVEEEAPGLTQLGAPQIETYNVSVYDFVNNTTALVTTTTGGNPNLVKEKQRDIKIAANWELPFMDQARLVVEYFRNRSSDVTQEFPLLTAAVEDAFPDRVTRGPDGTLLAIDRRPVTYDEVKTSSMRWGLNFSGSLGGESADGPPGGGRPAGGRGDGARAEGAGGPPGGPGQGGRFAAMRETLCAPDAPTPDPASLPERLRERLVDANGNIDPEKLAQFKSRACSQDGAGGFDPERFARLRTLLCTDEKPDLATLPEGLAQRLRGEDGQIDEARLAQMRERVCNAEAPAGAAAGQRSEPANPPSPPPRQRGPGSRWNLAVFHSWTFDDEVTIAPGIPTFDQLSGDSIAAGGVPRHGIEAEGGLFKDGFGLRMNAEWQAPANVNGSGQPGSSDLRFGSTFMVDLRFFADLGNKEKLVEKVPFLKGSRLMFTVDNLFDSRQKVTDASGTTPIAYQRAYREPQGRVIGIDFRKLF